MKTTRTLRIAEEIKRELNQAICFELRNPNLVGISVSRVMVTPDLSLAKIYFILGHDPKKISEILKAFEKTKGFMRHYLAKNLRLRLVPDLVFYHDDAPEKLDRIEYLLGTIKHEDQ